MNDEIERDLQDGNSIYLWTVDTLDQDVALAMTPEEFAAEMRRLSDRARRRARRPAHRRALNAGAARVAPRPRSTDEPGLDDLRAGDDTPSAWHSIKDRHDVEMEAVAYVQYADLSPARARALGI